MIVLRTAREIELIHKACIISAEALQLAGEAVKPGVTTYEIDKIAYNFIKKQGAEPNFLHLYGFPATACISINDEVIHGIPSKSASSTKAILSASTSAPKWTATTATMLLLSPRGKFRSGEAAVRHNPRKPL